MNRNGAKPDTLYFVDFKRFKPEWLPRNSVITSVNLNPGMIARMSEAGERPAIKIIGNIPRFGDLRRRACFTDDQCEHVTTRQFDPAVLENGKATLILVKEVPIATTAEEMEAEPPEPAGETTELWDFDLVGMRAHDPHKNHDAISALPGVI